MKLPKKTILIIGNGPSTKELANFGFDKIPPHIDTFGMGLAYKEYVRLGWWPTYYACADQKVVKNNEVVIRSLILDPKVTVKRFFFPLDLVKSGRLEVIPHSSTGDFCFRKCVELGYEKIYLIGIDLDYKPLKEASILSSDEFNLLGLDMDFDTNRIYKIRRPVADNPNYFFPDYQDVGQIFSEPRGNSWHLLSWYRARELAESKKLSVRNIGHESALTFFDKLPLTTAFNAVDMCEVSFPTTKVSDVATKVFIGEKMVSDGLARELGPVRRNMAAFESSLEALSHEIADDFRGQKSDALKISVIIPCFNSETQICPCLESLARQTLPTDQFEVICVDDCSTDKTIELILSYQGRIPNLRLIRHEVNKKQGAARNSGLDIANGTYVTFVDADDFLRIDALELLLNTAAGKELVVAQHISVRYDKFFQNKVSNRHIKTTLKRSGIDGSFGWWPFGMLIARNLIEKCAIRFREGVSFEDIDFVIRVTFAASECIVSKEQIYFYVQRDGSTVMSMSEKKLSDSADAIATVFDLLQGENTEDKNIFSTTSNRWLNGQATRIRDGAGTSIEKIALAKFFISALEFRGLFKLVGEPLRNQIERKVSETPPVAIEASKALAVDTPNYQYLPWGNTYEDTFRGKVIFFCEVDYHIRSAVPIVRELTGRGIDSIIVDASRSTSFTANRPLCADEEKLYSDVNILKVNVAESLPFATDAAAFIFMNDLTYTKRLIFENFGFDVPTFGFYEGINDDWNVDRKALRRPYRSTDYLLLPGIYQRGFYQDRACRIVGLPNVRRRLTEKFAPPTEQMAVINVNFTYKVLEECRDDYVESAVRACEELGLKYVISQHPADKGDLSRFNVGSKSIYDLLARGSILISRFSTTMLEALAMGRPVVYHNPIKERVPKFMQSLGAFSKSHSVDSLKSSLKNELDLVMQGVDIRQRAGLFLHFHCNTAGEHESDAMAADAIAAVVTAGHPRFAFKKTAPSDVTLLPALGTQTVKPVLLTVPPTLPAPAAIPKKELADRNMAKKNLQTRKNFESSRNSADVEISLKKANILLQSMQFEDAMQMYLTLFLREPIATRGVDPLYKTYEFNAILAARKLGVKNLTSAESLLHHFGLDKKQLAN